MTIICHPKCSVCQYSPSVSIRAVYDIWRDGKQRPRARSRGLPRVKQTCETQHIRGHEARPLIGREPGVWPLIGWCRHHSAHINYGSVNDITITRCWPWVCRRLVSSPSSHPHLGSQISWGSDWTIEGTILSCKLNNIGNSRIRGLYWSENLQKRTQVLFFY